MGQTGASEVDCSKAPSFAHRCMPPPDLCPQGDFPAAKMIDSVPGVDPARKARLIKALDVDIAWRMHQVPLPPPLGSTCLVHGPFIPQLFRACVVPKVCCPCPGLLGGC